MCEKEWDEFLINYLLAFKSADGYQVKRHMLSYMFKFSHAFTRQKYTKKCIACTWAHVNVPLFDMKCFYWPVLSSVKGLPLPQLK